MLSQITVTGMPLCFNSYAVMRLPCSSGRVSLTITPDGNRASSAPLSATAATASAPPDHSATCTAQSGRPGSHRRSDDGVEPGPLAGERLLPGVPRDDHRRRVALGLHHHHLGRRRTTREQPDRVHHEMEAARLRARQVIARCGLTLQERQWAERQGEDHGSRTEYSSVPADLPMVLFPNKNKE